MIAYLALASCAVTDDSFDPEASASVDVGYDMHEHVCTEPGETYALPVPAALPLAFSVWRVTTDEYGGWTRLAREDVSSISATDPPTLTCHTAGEAIRVLYLVPT